MAGKKKKKKNGSKNQNFLLHDKRTINRKQVNVARTSDLGTPELENHHELKVEYVDGDGELTDPGKGCKRVRNLTQTTLDYLKRHGFLNDEQFDAGERFYWDCYFAGFVPRAMAPTLDGIPRSKTNRFFVGFAEGRVDCDRRYRYLSKQLAKRYVVRERKTLDPNEQLKTNITFFNVAYQVCIEGIAVDALEKWTNWPRRSGKKLIGLVFDEVYDIYDEMAHNDGHAPKSRR